MGPSSKHLLLLLSILLASCQQTPKTSIPTTTFTESLPSPTAVPTFPSLDPLFNVTPTLPDFARLSPITIDNASNLQPIIGLTQDIVYDVAWSPEGAFVVAATSHGLKSYSSPSLKDQPANLSPL